MSVCVSLCLSVGHTLETTLPEGLETSGRRAYRSQRCQRFVTVKLAVSCKLGAAWQLCEGLGPKYCHFYPVIVWALTN